MYSITAEGRAYFEAQMNACASLQIPLLFDFNVVIANLNKLEKNKALELVEQLRRNITSCAQSNEVYAAEYAEIPLVGRTIFDQHRRLYCALLEWLDAFEGQFRED